jgi:hypothetical protein
MDAKASLMELLEGINDPREARGKRHPLPALLALAVVSMLAGVNSYEGIVQFGKERGWEFLRQLGFTTRRGLFRRIEIEAFEAAVATWIGSRLSLDDSQHLAIDGKSLRGSRDAGTPAAHLVSAYAVDAGAVMAQLRVDAKSNEHKAALELLGILPIRGRVITGDAMFTHRDVCTKIVDGGGDYVLVVKDNQKNLLVDIKAAFAEPAEGLSPPPSRASCREFRPIY